MPLRKYDGVNKINTGTDWSNLVDFLGGENEAATLVVFSDTEPETTFPGMIWVDTS